MNYTTLRIERTSCRVRYSARAQSAKSLHYHGISGAQKAQKVQYLLKRFRQSNYNLVYTHEPAPTLNRARTRLSLLNHSRPPNGSERKVKRI